MRVHDIVLGPIILLLGLGLCVWSLFLPSPSNVAFGPGLFPKLVGSGLALSGLLTGLAGLAGLANRDRRPLLQKPAWLASLKVAVNFWVIPISIIFYVLAAEKIGFFAAATVILFVTMAANMISWLRALLVAVSVALIVNLVFASILHVPLPWGPLTNISGWFIW